MKASRRFTLTACLAYAAIVFLGSWAPFIPAENADFFAANFDVSSAWWTQANPWRRTDFFANVLLAGPLGCLGAALVALRADESSSLRRAVWWFLPIVCCFVVACGCESGQTLLDGRHPTLNDVFAQIIGGTLGVLLTLACRKPIRNALAWLDQETAFVPSASIANLLMLGTILWFLIPFDVVSSAKQLARKWSSRQIELIPFYRPIDSWSQLARDALLGMGVGIPLALWIWWGSGVKQVSRRSLPAAIVLLLALSISLEGLQVFIVGRVASATDSLFLFVGALATYSTLRYLRGSEMIPATVSAQAEDISLESTALDRLWRWSLIASLAAIAICMIEWYPFRFEFDARQIRDRLREQTSFFDASSSTSNRRYLSESIRVAVLAGTFGMLCGTTLFSVVWSKRRIVWLFTVTVAIAFATFVELGNLLQVDHRFDGLRLLLRFVSTILGVELVRLVLLNRRVERIAD